MRDVAERFWEKVDKSGGDDACWPFVGHRNPSGYGSFMYNGRPHAASRIAWMLTHGEMPVGKFVCHRCDKTCCCNPSHLFVGTHADNMKDMVSKGRHWMKQHPEKIQRGDQHSSRTRRECRPRGEKHHAAKLKADQVIQLRLMHDEGKKTMKEIAGIFGVTTSAVRRIVRRMCWQHV